MRNVIFGAVLVITAAVTWQVKGWTQPEVRTQTQTDTTYVDRVITKRDTVTETRPVERVIYKRETDTVFIRLPAPRSFARDDIRGLVGQDPVDITDETITLTRFDPHALRWTQDVYEIEPENLHITPSIGAQSTPVGVMADGRVGVQWKAIKGHLGYGYGTFLGEPHHALVGGLRWKPFSISF